MADGYTKPSCACFDDAAAVLLLVADVTKCDQAHTCSWQKPYCALQRLVCAKLNMTFALCMRLSGRQDQYVSVLGVVVGGGGGGVGVGGGGGGGLVGGRGGGGGGGGGEKEEGGGSGNT